jgi:DNA repair protein RecO (recombination protein O)
LSELYKTTALVLRSTPWSESSKIVHLFTPDKGIIKVIAKGALQPKSDFRGVLETLNHIEIVVAHKESRGLQILSAASTVNSFLRTKENLNKTAITFSFLELIGQFLKLHEPVPDFFHYTIRTIGKLDNDSNQNFKQYLWQFVLKISTILGFGWDFTHCLICGLSLTEGPFFPDYQKGGIICSNCNRLKKLGGQELNISELEILNKLNTAALNSNQFGQLLKNVQRDFTNILLQHLSYHTDTFVELISLKLYN